MNSCSSLAPIARYASFWNVTVITVSAIAQEFRINKKREYKTLTNLGATVHSLEVFVQDIFEKFGWKRVIFIFDKEYQETGTNYNCYLTMASLKSALLNARIVVDYKLRDKSDRRSIDEILHDYVGIKFSVIMLCGSPDFVIDVMIAANKLGFCNGEYVFINIDIYCHMHNKDRLLRPWLASSKNSSLIERSQSAYEALLIITLKVDDKYEKYGNFKKKLLEFSNGAYINDSQVIIIFEKNFKKDFSKIFMILGQLFCCFVL